LQFFKGQIVGLRGLKDKAVNSRTVLGIQGQLAPMVNCDKIQSSQHL